MVNKKNINKQKNKEGNMKTNSLLSAIENKVKSTLFKKDCTMENIVDMFSAIINDTSRYTKYAYDIISEITGVKIPSDLRLSSISVQQMVYDAIVDYVNGERNEKLINKLAFELRRIKLNDIKLRKRVVATMFDTNEGGRYSIKIEKLYERYTVFEWLKDKGVIPEDYHMALLRHIDRPDGNHEFIKEALKYMAETKRHVIASKSAATKVIYKKADKIDDITEAIFELASVIKAQRWLMKHTRRGKILYKAISKLGVLLLRNGTQFTPGTKLTFVIKDMPSCDGVVAYVRPGILSMMFTKEDWNKSYAFQGTIADPKLGIYGKGMFTEVPNSVFDIYSVDDDVDMIINKDSIIGNILFSKKSVFKTDSECLFVMNSSADYDPSAQLSRQFITYQWGTTEKDCIKLKELTDTIIDKLKYATNNGTYERLVLHGFNNKSYLVYKETLSSFIRGFVRQHTTIDLKHLGLGDSHIIIGLEEEAFKALLKSHRIHIDKETDLRKVVLLPKTTSLAVDRIYGAKGFKVGMFKNPVTPTLDCPGEYTAFIGRHSGSIVFCHADADHRLASGHDYDGDNVVIFHGDLLNYLRDRSEMLPNLADIKLNEKDTYVSTIDDIFNKILVQMSAPIGLFEYGANVLWSTKEGTYYTYDKLNNIQIRKPLYLAVKQIQGWITAQKKDIEGLIDAKAFIGYINEELGGKPMPVRAALNKLNGVSFNQIVKTINGFLSMNYNKKNGLMKIINNNLRIIVKLINKYNKIKSKKGYIKTEIYHLKKRSWIKGNFVLNHQNLAYAVIDTFHPELKDEVVSMLKDRKFYIPLLNFGKTMNMLSDLRKKADGMIFAYKIKNNDNPSALEIAFKVEEDISTLYNELMFNMNIFLYAIAGNIRKSGGFNDKSIWCAAAQKVSESVFFNCASYRFIDEMILTYDALASQGLVKDQFDKEVK